MDKRTDLTIEQAIERFMRKLTAAKNHYIGRCYTNLPQDVSFQAEFGQRNVRIVECEAGKPRNVYAFVELETGKIMKAAGYKAPEPKRTERGNVYNVNPLEGMGPHGPFYAARSGHRSTPFHASDVAADSGD